MVDGGSAFVSGIGVLSMGCEIPGTWGMVGCLISKTVKPMKQHRPSRLRTWVRRIVLLAIEAAQAPSLGRGTMYPYGAVYQWNDENQGSVSLRRARLYSPGVSLGDFVCQNTCAVVSRRIMALELLIP